MKATLVRCCWCWLIMWCAIRCTPNTQPLNTPLPSSSKGNNEANTYAFAYPPPPYSPNSWKQTLGINGIWGWGNQQGSNTHDTIQGVNRFKRISLHLRSYHEWNWDTPQLQQTPIYTGEQATVQSWVQWDKEYAAWRQAGGTVLASIKFDNQTQPLSGWNNPYQQAYNYGFAFARHFGRLHGNGLVDGIEIGNEPWNYPPDFYQNALRGMLHGIRFADSTLQILPCALQNAQPQAEQSDLKNYASARLPADVLPYLSAFNGHYYSYHTPQTPPNATALPPEHPQSTFRRMIADLHYRDSFMQGKKFYITEFGWDSSAKHEACTHPACVSEQQQAAYWVRTLCIAMRLGIDRAYGYFYANTVSPDTVLYARSGLCESAEARHQPKAAYYAVQQWTQQLGDLHFVGIHAETDTLFAYLLGKPNAVTKPTHVVAWQPANRTIAVPLKRLLPAGCWLPQRSYKVWQWNATSNSFLTKQITPTQQVSLNEMPLIIRLD